MDLCGTCAARTGEAASCGALACAGMTSEELLCWNSAPVGSSGAGGTCAAVPGKEAEAGFSLRTFAPAAISGEGATTAAFASSLLPAGFIVGIGSEGRHIIRTTHENERAVEIGTLKRKSDAGFTSDSDWAFQASITLWEVEVSSAGNERGKEKWSDSHDRKGHRRRAEIKGGV